MTIAWFLCPYKRRTGVQLPQRYCAMDDYTTQIRADGGDWSETEVLDTAVPPNVTSTAGWAVVKVRASDTTLATIAATTGFTRITGVIKLTDLLVGASVTMQNVLLAFMQTQGYALSEIQTRFPSSLALYTLGDVLRFIASRRQRPQYNSATDVITCDGQIDPVRSVDSVDGAVQ